MNPKDDTVEEDNWRRSQRLELRFQRSSPYYAKKADEIDEQFIEKWKTALEKKLIQKFSVPYISLENQDILEIGCGSRGDVNVIDGSGRRVGIDPLIDEFRKHGTLYQASNVELYPQRGEAIRFAENSYDIILCFNVIDHVQSIEGTLEEIFRVLRPQGKLLLSVHTYEFFSAMTPRMILSRIDPPHPHHFSHKEIIRNILGTGFGLERYRLEPFKMHYGSLFFRFATLLFGRNLWLVASKQ